ncbi:MAG: twin-arginine translocase TatA/TatE family subunit [Pirellulales bacterium]|nr:twin-arginine translocase TatA/TatE family subunit [Pirellulales bacterium]
MCSAPTQFIVGNKYSGDTFTGEKMFGLGPLELMVIGVIAVMLYGKQLPDVGLKVGKSLSELRRQWSNISRDLDVTGEIKGQNGQAYNGSRRLSSQFDDEENSQTSPAFDPPSSSTEA